MKIRDVLSIVEDEGAAVADCLGSGGVTTKNLSGKELPMGFYTRNLLRKKKIRKVLKEELNLINFYYKNHHHDRFPRVMALDYAYPGMKGQKSYGEREDILGWNINYYENKEEAKKIINDIDTFARMVSNNNEEKYKRIKYFFPEQSELLRRYNKQHVKMLRVKGDNGLWRRTNYDELKEKHKKNL